MLPHKDNCSNAVEEYNCDKNRYEDKLPCKCIISEIVSFNNTYFYTDNNSRPRLRETSSEGSDYINASFIDVSVTEYVLLLF